MKISSKRRTFIACSIISLFYGCDGHGNVTNQLSSTPGVPSANVQQPNEKSAQSSGNRNALGSYVSFPACETKIRQPSGFEESESFDGFAQPATGSSVMAISIAVPYSKNSEGFTTEQMKAAGWTLLSKEDVKVNGLACVLVHFKQPARGDVFLKWSLAFGDEQKTRMVTATFPQEQERNLSALLKSAVLSSQIDQRASAEVAAELPFAIIPSQKLKPVPGISRALSFNKEGVFPGKSPEEPVFIVAPSIGQVLVADERTFAERRLRESAKATDLEIKSTEAVTIAGLNGFELLAEADHPVSGTPLIIYQVILFDDGSYFLMQGRVGAELREEYLPEFKEIARSFRKKRT